MTYLVKTDDKIVECENFTDVQKELLKATLEWTLSDIYEGESFLSLFDKCLNNCDFGDIASVYEINSYFTVNNHEIPCELKCMDKNIPTTITKIL